MGPGAQGGAEEGTEEGKKAPALEPNQKVAPARQAHSKCALSSGGAGWEGELGALCTGDRGGDAPFKDWKERILAMLVDRVVGTAGGPNSTL